MYKDPYGVTEIVPLFKRFLESLLLIPIFYYLYSEYLNLAFSISSYFFGDQLLIQCQQTSYWYVEIPFYYKNL